MITAFIIVGIIVAASTVFAVAACSISGRKREAWEDDEQASILAEQTSKRLIAFPNTAVSAPR